MGATDGRRGWKGLANPRAATVAVCGLLLAPLLVEGVPPDRVSFGWPLVFRGDEPHYLVILTSLLRDGDLDLGNNYESARLGGLDGGRLWSGTRTLDNHTSAVVDGRRVPWAVTYVFDAPANQWGEDAGGRHVPPLRPGRVPFPPGAVERSVHQPGIAFVLAPLLVPVRHSDHLESYALALVAAAVVAGFLLFRWLLLGLGAGPWAATGTAAAAFLGTPAWFYARVLFVEGLALPCLVGAYAVYLRRGWATGAGLLLAVSLEFKAYFAVLAVPIAVDLMVQRRWWGVVKLSAGVVLGVAALVAQNWYYLGDPLIPPQPFEVGSFADGSVGLLFNGTYGLLWISPVAVAAAACWPAFLKDRPREAALLLAPCLLLYVVISFYAGWHGVVYGPRYLVPVLPLFFASLVNRRDPFAGRLLGPQLVGVLAAVSVAINAAGAFDHWWSWLKNPAVEFAAYMR